MFGVKNVLLRAAENSLNLESVRRDLAFLSGNSWTKILVRMCTSFQNDMYNTEGIFLVMGNFHRAKIARN